MTPHAVLRELVPEAPLATPPAGHELVESRLVGGVPSAVQVGPLALVLLLPSGLARTWREAAPGRVVSDAAWERAPHLALADAPVATPVRPPFRLVARDGAVTTAVVPLVAGRRQRLPDASGGGVLDLALLGWTIRAGTLQGPGDVGSRLRLAWRPAAQAPAEFAPLPPNRYLLPRLVPGLRLESAPLARARLAPTLSVRPRS